MTRRFVVEADGGSRGNPGPAGYGALVRDADTGRLLAERAASVGRATNNVAEYGGLVAGLPDLTAVTGDGDLVSAHYVAGGSSAQPSLIEVQAAVDDAERRLAEAQHRCERLRFGQTELEERLRQTHDTVEATLARLHESDAAMAAVRAATERLGRSR